MFYSLFKKKKTPVYAPVSGTVISLQEVEDEVFSSEMMGIGFAVRPEKNIILSPIDGVIESIFPSKHAFTVKGNKGLEILVHIGIDTVELNGEGFSFLVKAGQKVSAQQKIAIVDFELIKSSGKGTDIMVIFPSLDKSKRNLFDFSNRKDFVAELE